MEWIKDNKMKKIMFDHLDMPKHKIEYIISIPSLVQGLWDHLNHYGIFYSEKNHEMLITIVQELLEGNPHTEREWTKVEYETFVLFDGNMKLEINVK